MNSNELRIGNLVNSRDGGLLLVEKISETHINDTDINIYNPIPLTEEWLNKLNCKGGYFYKHDYFRWVDALGGLVEFSNKAENEDVRGVLIARGVQYVHQLQNLYFALTNTELCIKE